MSDSGSGQQWLGGRRSSGIAAVAVLLLVVVAGVVWWHARSGDSAPADGSPGPTQTVQPLPPTGQDASAPAGGDQAVPTAAPQDVTWQLWHSVALPSSASAGPVHVDGQVASGFAHTPTGALVAMVQASARRIAATDPGWQDVVERMIAPGPGRDAWLKTRSQATHSQPPPPGTFAQIAGFQFVSYTPTDAAIQLVNRTQNGALSVSASHMVWQGNDWKMVLAPDGSDSANAQQINSLAGFIAWGGY